MANFFEAFLPLRGAKILASKLFSLVLVAVDSYHRVPEQRTAVRSLLGEEPKACSCNAVKRCVRLSGRP